MSRAAGHSAGGRTTADAHIDRLALRVAGLDEDAARTLARLVAERLTPDLLMTTGAAALDHLHVMLDGDAGRPDPDVLAQRIVGQIARALARERGSSADAGGLV